MGDVPDLSSAIVAERDNVVVDGAGYVLQGNGSTRAGATTKRNTPTPPKLTA